MASFAARPMLSNGLHSFDVGSGEKIQLKDFVRKVHQASGNTTTELNFGALPYRPNEIMDTPIDVSVLKKLGWVPKVNLEEGLRRTIEFEKMKRTEQ
jgi:nucleoside-diphosphate-sugar epimerase